MKKHSLIFLLSTCISFVAAQDTLKTGMTDVFSDSMLITDQKKAIPEKVLEAHPPQSESLNSFAPASYYKWIIETNSGIKYTSCRFTKIEGDTLFFQQYVDSKSVELISLHLFHVKAVSYHIMPRMLTRVVGGALGIVPGLFLGLNLSIAFTGTYEHLEFLIAGGVGGVFAGRWVLQELFNKKHDLSILNLEMKRDRLQAIIYKK